MHTIFPHPTLSEMMHCRRDWLRPSPETTQLRAYRLQRQRRSLLVLSLTRPSSRTVQVKARGA
jgi:hypothetical protein